MAVFVIENAGAATKMEDFIDLPLSWKPKSAESELNMIFTGDIMLGRYIKTLRTKHGGDFPFTFMPEILEKMRETMGADSLDFVIGNLEGPVTVSDYVNPGTAMRFNFDPEVANLLKKVGFTHLSLANNHSHDMGKEGHPESVAHLQAAGLTAFGHPDTPEGEWSFTHTKKNGVTIGFLGFNDAVTRLDKDAALKQIARYESLVDFLIIGIHWGVEYEKTARPAIQDFAYEMVDAGADFIWGHHPHVIQNSEIYNEAPIYYSLGNFVFDQYWSADTQEGLVVGLKIKGDKISTFEMKVDLAPRGEPKP